MVVESDRVQQGGKVFAIGTSSHAVNLSSFSQEKRPPAAGLRSSRPPESGRICLCVPGAMQSILVGNRTMHSMGKFFCLLVLWQATGIRVRADESVTLREPFAPGYQYHVSSRVDLAGRFTMPAAKGKEAQSLQVTRPSALEYDERILTRDPVKTIRYYGRMDFQPKTGD